MHDELKMSKFGATRRKKESESATYRTCLTTGRGHQTGFVVEGVLHLNVGIGVFFVFGLSVVSFRILVGGRHDVSKVFTVKQRSSTVIFEVYVLSESVESACKCRFYDRSDGMKMTKLRVVCR